jgi:hypothetical protein
MGYNLELRFDLNEEHNSDDLVNKFCQAGAELIDDPHYDEPVIHIPGLTNIWLSKCKINGKKLIYSDHQNFVKKEKDIFDWFIYSMFRKVLYNNRSLGK